MERRLILTLLLLTSFVLGARSQNVSDLIISEVLATPDSTGFQDDFGRRSGWIELYNTSTGTVSFGGCYLTDDLNDLKKSLIPKNDLRTKLGPRQVTVLFASGEGNDGTFYAGFTLSPGKTVYLISNDGKTVVDSLPIPKDLAPGESVSKHASDAKMLRWISDGKGGEPSPMVRNGDQNAETNAQIMAPWYRSVSFSLPLRSFGSSSVSSSSFRPNVPQPRSKPNRQRPQEAELLTRRPPRPSPSLSTWKTAGTPMPPSPSRWTFTSTIRSMTRNPIS